MTSAILGLELGAYPQDPAVFQFDRAGGGSDRADVQRAEGYTVVLAYLIGRAKGGRLLLVGYKA